MKYKHLSIEEREKIQEFLWQSVSIRTIATALHRSPSSVGREIQRNGTPELRRYSPRLARLRATEYRKHRGRTERLKNERIRSYVVAHLKQRWSPEQIARRLRLDQGEHISHEAIYQFIYHRVCKGSNLTKQGLEDLRPCLRRRRRIRLPHGARKCQRIFKLKGPSIEDRPLIVDKRKRVGDWEGDTVESRDHKPGINTLVERKTGLVFISKLKDKTSAATVAVMKRRLLPVPQKFKQTVTLDNGPENSNWQAIQSEINIACYHAHPYCSGERGTNENTNGLIRDYFPKKTDFDTIPDDDIRFVESELNNRPRKRLGWKTPLEVWSVALQS